MLSLKDKIKLVEELIQQDKDSTVGHFLTQLKEIEHEIKLIKQVRPKKCK